MGYLTKIFDKYYETQDYNIVKEFRNRLWNTLPYIKLERSYGFFIGENISLNDIELIKKYNHQNYKILKSRYSKEEMFPEDYIKARLNSNYAKYFDKELYLDKKYYYYLANYKNIYFKYLEGEIEDLEIAFKNNAKKVKEYKRKSLKNKLSLSWKEYKGVVDRTIDNVFRNYVPIDVKIEKGEFIPNSNLDWDEDNSIIGYVNKSIQGEVINFIKVKKELVKPRYKITYCTICGKQIMQKSKKTPKYCTKCAKEIRKENTKIYVKKHRNKNVSI